MKRARPGKKSALRYPLVDCSHHNGDPLPGYVVCVHAMADPTVSVVVEQATKTSAGTVLCAGRCSGDRDLPVEMLKTTCAHFVRDTFQVPL